MAKDRGKVTMKVDGEEHCSTYWLAHAFAKGQNLATNMLNYSETGKLGDPSSTMPAAGAKQLLELLDQKTPIAISITHSYKINERDYVEIVAEVAGYTLEEWKAPLTATVKPKTMGYMMSADKNGKHATLTGTIRRGDVTEQYYGLDGTMTFESWDFPKQAFKGSYKGTIIPIEGLSKGGTQHAVEATFDIRLFD